MSANTCSMVTVIDWSATGAMLGAGGTWIAALATIYFYRKLVANDDARMTRDEVDRLQAKIDRQAAEIAEHEFNIKSEFVETLKGLSIFESDSHVDVIQKFGTRFPNNRKLLLLTYAKFLHVRDEDARDRMSGIIMALEQREPGAWDSED